MQQMEVDLQALQHENGALHHQVGGGQWICHGGVGWRLRSAKTGCGVWEEAGREERAESAGSGSSRIGGHAPDT